MTQPPDIAALTAAPAAEALLGLLESHSDPANAAGMARFGISGVGLLGISMKTLRSIAAPLVRARKADADWRHDVALGLWATRVHEARILGILVEDPSRVTRQQARQWARDSDSWDITDQLCLSLLDRTEFAYDLAEEWSAEEHEFLKRAAFALMACLAWHDKSASDERLLRFVGLVEREAHDPRNFVKKAVSWALRTVGKRSSTLHGPALDAAMRLAASADRAERWVGRDAVRELDSTPVRQRLGLTGV